MSLTKPVEAQVIEQEWESTGYQDFRDEVIETVVENELEDVETELKADFAETIEEELGINPQEMGDLGQELQQEVDSLRTEFEEEYQQQALELKDELTTDPENRVKHNLDLLGAALSVNKLYREQSPENRDVEPLEVRGGAVFSHLYDEVGNDLFSHWPRIWDTDKYFPAGESENERVSLMPMFENTYGDIVEKSKNTDNHEGVKYTAQIDLLSEDSEKVYGPGNGFEADMMRPETEGDSEYSFAEEDTTRVEFAPGYSFKIPSIEEMIRHKGTITRENEEGQDEFREKDGTELLALMYVAEQKDVGPESLEDQYSGEEFSMIADRVQDFATDINRSIPGTYAPEDSYLEEFIGRARKYSV